MTKKINIGKRPLKEEKSIDSWIMDDKRGTNQDFLSPSQNDPDEFKLITVKVTRAQHDKLKIFCAHQKIKIRECIGKFIDSL